MGKRLVAITFLSMIAGLLAAASASAAVFTVNSTGQQADATPGNGVCATAEGTCTLRAALEEANALLGSDEINVPAGNYPATTWMPTISQSLKLHGTAGATQTTVDFGGTSNRLSISGGGNVEVEGLTFTGLNGTGSTVSVNGPDTTFREVSIEENRSTAGNGAGLRIQTAQVTMIRSSVTDNLAVTSSATYGGGISVMTGSSLTAIASTIARNRIQTADTTGMGGGIFASGSLVLRHVTLKENSVQSTSAANYGGNLYVSSGSQTSIEDSVLTDGSTSSSQSRNCGIAGSGATLTTTGNNIYDQLGNFSCVFSPGTVAATTTEMTSLGDHGGVGLTYVPLTNSAAVNAASGCPEGGLDQRGVKAPTGPACDIGAVELAANVKVQLTAASGPVAPGASVFHTAVLTNAGLDTAVGTTLALSPSAGLTILAVSDGTCSPGGECTFGTLTPGMSRTVTFSAKAPASGQLVTNAVGGSETPDPAPDDAIASATTKVKGAAPVIKKFRVIGKLRSGVRGKVGLRLSRPATVKITVQRLRKGKSAKKVGTVKAKRKAGPSKIKLPSRFRGRKLAPGRYRLTAVATAPSGRSKPVKITVRVRK